MSTTWVPVFAAQLMILASLRAAPPEERTLAAGAPNQSVVTVVAVHVPVEHQDTIAAAFGVVTEDLQGALLWSALVRKAPDDYRIIGLWRSRDEMETIRRRSRQGLTSEQVLRLSGNTPSFDVFEVTSENPPLRRR